MLVNLTGVNKHPNYQNINRNSSIRFAENRNFSSPDNMLCHSVPISFRGTSELDFRPVPIIQKYVTPEVIQSAIERNPNILFILKYYGIKPEVSELNIGDGLKKHLFTTYLYAKEIAEATNLDWPTKEKLYKAALVHDVGKALIPESVMQKPARLTPDEQRIVDLHPILGYEILKTTDLDEDSIEAVRLHHTKFSEKEHNIISQILSVADVFSALREERAYKTAMTSSEAFNIMECTPELSQTYVNLLKCNTKESAVD